MWSYLSLSVAILVGSMAIMAQMDDTSTFENNEKQAIATNSLIYHKQVTNYATSNPGVSGQIANNALSLPAWYIPFNSLKNYVEAGKGYVYIANESSDIAYRISQYTNGSASVGRKVNGNFIPLISTGSPTPLPSSIPEGSTVIAP